MTRLAESPDCHWGLVRESVTQLVKYATRGTAFVSSIWVYHVNATAVFRLIDVVNLDGHRDGQSDEDLNRFIAN